MIDRKVAIKQLKFLDGKAKKMRLAADKWENDWQILVAIMLSARTLDETVIYTCEKMFKKYSTPESIVKLDVNKIENLIRSVNFFQNKAKYLSLMSKRIIEEFNGEVPNTVEDLITLAGVGRKTANVFLSVKGGSHIGVDTHVTYISNYLGWVNTKDPLKIEKELEKLFSKNMWNKISVILIRFGKTYTSKKIKDVILNEARELSKIKNI